ncbi:MAG: N-acetyltransferase [Myxococcales bacterium]|nr:N-acetyltransferase [Myxococcales bacterium]
MVDMSIHPSAIVDPGCELGEGTRIWHHVHVMSGARIGKNCVLGQGCFVAGGVRIGDGCRIQNHVSLYDGVTLEDDVFLGPSCVFTNVRYPRAHVARKAEYAPTRISRGATIGANATVVCGVTVGPYAMVGAGAVVTCSLPAHALAVGAPARRVGWVCRCGEPLRGGPSVGPVECARCGDAYVTSGELGDRCERVT